MRHHLLLIPLFAAAPAWAQLSLTADREPDDKSWESPATIAYTRDGNHQSNTAIDAYLSYKHALPAQATRNGARADSVAVSGYVHRNNQGDARQNDRGLALSFKRFIVADNNNAGPVTSLAWNAKLSAGKTLLPTGSTDAGGVPQYDDVTKDRQQVFLSGYLQPALAGSAHGGGPRAVLGRTSVQHLGWNAGIYSDHNSGGSGLNKGRLSGANGAVEWSVMPLGLIAGDNRLGGYGVIPVLALKAQIQHDFSANGARTKDTYKLYSAALRFDFETLNTGGVHLIPSLVLKRSIGADLLAGRAYEGKTEIAFGLSF